MDAPPEREDDRAVFPPERRPAGLASLAARIDTIGARFDAAHAIGVLLIDAHVLASVETGFGGVGRDRAEAALASLVCELAEEHLDLDDLVVAGEVGRNELVVLVFREPCDSHFYRHELPNFDQALRQCLERSGSRALYPYFKKAPTLHSGSAVAIRNPKLSSDTQIRRCLEEARANAELSARIGSQARRRRMIELVLDRGVTSVYEPIVEVASRTVFGYEALARGPEGTEFHSPLALFGIAEEEDLLFELDCLCRASALEGAIDYPAGTKLFLNIRPTSIHDPNFRTDRLIETLARSQLSPSDVVFEISEQESIENFHAFLEIRDDYRNLGFQFALDDMGAGYAGLEALLELTPEFIKVDRAFVSGIDQDPARQDLVSALMSVASRTGAKIIGEGLDTLAELETLGDLGIPYGQGWLFGKPTPLRARP